MAGANDNDTNNFDDSDEEDSNDGLPPPPDISELIHLRQTDWPAYTAQTNVILRVLIEGICDDGSILSIFSGTLEIVQRIWEYVLYYWRRCIKEGSRWESEDTVCMKLTDACLDMYERLSFPEPTDIRINMMPFLMARTFEESKLPDYLAEYWDMFFDREYWLYHSGYTVVNLISEQQLGNIGYLTIDEGFVEAGATQRRPGLHTDCPGKLMLCRENTSENYICLGRKNPEEEKALSEIIDAKYGHGYVKENTVNYAHPWGMRGTATGTELVGGIYMASNVKDSCQVWNCALQSSADGSEIIGNLGDTEHLRDVLPNEPELMEADKVYWITDRTPHESLPLKEGTYRQFFRFVTSEVSLWFEEHSTKNPLGIVPDPEKTVIVKGSKFEDNFALLNL